VLHTSTNGLTANAVAGLKLEFSAPGGSTVPPPSENFPFDADSTSNAWVMIDIGSVGIEVPDTASIARITMIMFPDTSTNSVVYFDQAFASLSRAPSTNLLLNPSFENGFGGPNGIDNWVEFGPEAQLSFEVGGLKNDLVTEDFFEASAKMAGNDFTGLSQDIALPSTLLPNESLYVRAFVRQQDNEAQSLQGTARAGVKIEWVAGTVPRRWTSVRAPMATPSIPPAPRMSGFRWRLTSRCLRATQPSRAWFAFPWPAPVRAKCISTTSKRSLQTGMTAPTRTAMTTRICLISPSCNVVSTATARASSIGIVRCSTRMRTSTSIWLTSTTSSRA
jgi:hypothetical protein